MLVKNASLMIDAHVHFYDCFEPCEFLASAYNNLSASLSPKSAESEKNTVKILLLTETAKESAFERLRASTQSASAATDDNRASFCTGDETWYSELCDEDDSVLLKSSSGKELYIIAGSQVNCREGLEVHALASNAEFDEGLPLVEIIDAVKASGAVVALPWGAGKWLGRRGKILSDMSDYLSQADVMLSDSGIRPWIWPRASLFERGLNVIAGTDPLPVAAEATRVGSFGFAALSDWDPARPAASVRKMLKGSRFKAELFGSSQALLQFVSRQIEIRR